MSQISVTAADIRVAGGLEAFVRRVAGQAVLGAVVYVCAPMPALGEVPEVPNVEDVPPPAEEPEPDGEGQPDDGPHAQTLATDDPVGVL